MMDVNFFQISTIHNYNMVHMSLYCMLYHVLLDNLMADLLADENNLKYIVGEQHYVIQAVIPLREKFLFSGKKNPPLKMNECNFLHHYKWNGGNLYFQFNFLKRQNRYLHFNISQKYPSFLTFFWKVGLGLGCIWQQFCQSDPEYIRFACNAKFICSGTRSNLQVYCRATEMTRLKNV